MSLTYIEATAPGQFVTLGADAPGHIDAWDLQASGPVITTRGAFLAAWGSGINITMAMASRPGAALFGGAGLILQRIEGHGTVLVYGRGDFVKAELAAGEALHVSTGNLAAFSGTVDYDIETVGWLTEDPLQQGRVVHDPVDRARNRSGADAETRGGGPIARVRTARSGGASAPPERRT